MHHKTPRMRKLFLLMLAALAFTSSYAQYTTGRTCAPFDSTFHYLKAGNLNFWVEGGLLSTIDDNNFRLYNAVAFDMHYVPVKYLQTGVNLTKRLPSPQGVNYWKSYELSLYARYSFLRMDCPKMGVFVQAGYTDVVEVKKADASKSKTWMPYAGIGIYKDISKGFMIQFENALYFRQRPDQASLKMVWKFMNMKLKGSNR